MGQERAHGRNPCTQGRPLVAGTVEEQWSIWAMASHLSRRMATGLMDQRSPDYTGGTALRLLRLAERWYRHRHCGRRVRHTVISSVLTGRRGADLTFGAGFDVWTEGRRANWRP